MEEKLFRILDGIFIRYQQQPIIRSRDLPHELIMHNLANIFPIINPLKGKENLKFIFYPMNPNFRRSIALRKRAPQRSRYSDWLRPGRSGDRIPVGSRIPAPVQTSPGADPSSCTMGTGSFLGVKSSHGVTLTPHPVLVPLS
jgi:hypothetical protein